MAARFEAGDLPAEREVSGVAPEVKGVRKGTSETSPVHAKILAAADRLFYAHGLRAVSADTIIAAAGVSKVTFYRHFPTKDDLIVAYLRGRSQRERDALEGVKAAHPDDARSALRRVADGIGRISCEAGFRGCPFLNAAAEYSDAAHPIRRMVAEHREWFSHFLTDLLRQLGVDRCDDVAARLVMLRDGAMVAGYMSNPDAVAGHLVEAGRAIVRDAEASQGAAG